MSQPNNGQALSHTQDARSRYTGEILLRTRPKTYRKIVSLLTEGVSDNRITEVCRVTDRTVRAVRLREAATITERKKELAFMLSDVAHIGTGRVADTIGKASMRDAAIATGIATDKMLALQGQSSVGVQVAVVMPTEEERAERRALHDKLDEIARRLADGQTPDAE